MINTERTIAALDQEIRCTAERARALREIRRAAATLLRRADVRGGWTFAEERRWNEIEKQAAALGYRLER